MAPLLLTGRRAVNVRSKLNKATNEGSAVKRDLCMRPKLNYYRRDGSWDGATGVGPVMSIGANVGPVMGMGANAGPRVGQVMNYDTFLIAQKFKA